MTHTDIASLLTRCREFIDTATMPAYPAGADIADDIDAALAALAQQPATSSSPDFIRRSNEDYVAWCATFYNPDALDERGMPSLHGLWAWREQEHRKRAGIKAPSVQAPNNVKPVAVVRENLAGNEARVQYLFNPVPVGAELQWDHNDLASVLAEVEARDDAR